MSVPLYLVIFKDLSPAGAFTVAVTDAVAPILPEKVVADRVTVGLGLASSLQALMVRTAVASKPMVNSAKNLVYFIKKTI
jgi:hypothetical protein